MLSLFFTLNLENKIGGRCNCLIEIKMFIVEQNAEII